MSIGGEDVKEGDVVADGLKNVNNAQERGHCWEELDGVQDSLCSKAAFFLAVRCNDSSHTGASEWCWLGDDLDVEIRLYGRCWTRTNKHVLTLQS